MNHKHLMTELGKLEFQGERLTVQLELELTAHTYSHSQLVPGPGSLHLPAFHTLSLLQDFA